MVRRRVHSGRELGLASGKLPLSLPVRVSEGHPRAPADPPGQPHRRAATAPLGDADDRNLRPQWIDERVKGYEAASYGVLLANETAEVSERR